MANEITHQALRSEILRDSKTYRHLNKLLKLNQITRSTFLQSISELIFGSIAYGTAITVDNTRRPTERKRKAVEQAHAINRNLIFGGRLFEEYQSGRALQAIRRHTHAFYSSESFNNLPDELKSLFLPQGMPGLDVFGAIPSAQGLTNLVSGSALIAGNERMGLPAAIAIASARAWVRSKENKEARSLASTFVGFKAKEELEQAIAALRKPSKKNK